MRKISLSFILTLVLLLTTFVIIPSNSASALVVGDFQYEVLDDGTAEITWCTSTEENLVIPSALDGHTVSGVGTLSLSTNECQNNLKTLVIPNTVTRIGNSAFHNCKKLTDITMPDSLRSIGGTVFSGCNNLHSIRIPASVTSIAAIAFSLSSISRIDIDDLAAWCSIKFGSDNKINAGLYLNGERITDLVIPDSVTSIPDNAFWGCGIESVTIPDSVTRIGKNTFAQCNIKSVIIPDSVKSIGDKAFTNCDSLTRVVIPDSITSIGENAFFACGNLTEVTIPASVTSLGKRAFGYKDYSAKVNGFTIKGYVDTEANKYAKRNNLTFVDIMSLDVLGDADGDREVTVTDVTIIQRKLVDLHVPDFNEIAVDVDGDGLDITDATYIQRYLAKLKTPYPIGETFTE